MEASIVDTLTIPPAPIFNDGHCVDTPELYAGLD
jgi:hypothetical protein